MAFNHDLFDAFVVRATDLQKLTASQKAKALDFLRLLEQDLIVDIARADLPGYQMPSYQEARMRALLGTAQETIKHNFLQIAVEQESDLATLADAEQEFVMKAINDIAGVDLASTALSAEQINVIASDTLIAGAPSANWWSQQADAVTNRFAQTVRLGVARGQTNDQISKAVKDNVSKLATDNADILVRTSVQTISSAARLESFDANDDVIDAIQQHSTLDGRTTLICMAYSGKRFTNDADHKPLDDLPFINAGGSINGIPRHWGCRSYWLPVVKSWKALGKAGGLKTGGRPAADVDAYFRSRLRKRGFDEDQIAAIVRNTQASMDGAVPESMNYEDWLKTKPASFQEEQLGPARYRLWKKGKLQFSQLVNRDGEPMTIEELKRKTA